MDEFVGAICGCCGTRFSAEQADDAIRHAGMTCGPVLRLPDEIGTINDGQPCPHGQSDWLGINR